MHAPLSIDIFCRVINFFGDIGVCWRVAQQLRRDHGCAVRLIVDDFATFAHVVPALDVSADVQMCDGITVLRWDDEVLAAHYGDPSDAVIEAFACTLPDLVVEAMKAKPPVWIDLEYLSAEDWVEDCHAIPSWHPATGLNKTLFFPGFTPRTGGLFREGGLKAARDAFVADIGAQNDWRAQYGLPPKVDGTVDISLFCYANAPVRSLFAAIDAAPLPVRVFVTAGIPQDALRAAGLEGHPAVVNVPFLSQGHYDRLLWTADVNFVRGEDSFLRANWAGKPFFWHIHPQNAQAHMVKLDAFLGLYTAKMPPDIAQTLVKSANLWNERGRIEADLPKPDDPDWLSLLPQLDAQAHRWTEDLFLQADLASQLTEFIRRHKNN